MASPPNGLIIIENNKVSRFTGSAAFETIPSRANAHVEWKRVFEVTREPSQATMCLDFRNNGYRRIPGTRATDVYQEQLLLLGQ